MPIVSTISARLPGSSEATARRGILQLVQQFDREAGEVVDEIERVFDLVRDAGGHLAERRHLLRMDQARLRDLQLAQCRLGGVSRRADGFLGALALGDVGIDQHKAAARHRVAAHLDDPAVGPRALEAHLPSGVFDGAAQLRFEIGRVLAAVSEIAEILGIARPLRQEGVRQIEHLLEIAVPRGEAHLGVEHDDAVAHIVEGDAQLGLALAQLVEQSRILDRDHRLIGEGRGQFDLLFRKSFDARPVQC